MKKKALTITAIALVAIAVPLIILGIFILQEDTSFEDMMVANVSANSATVVVLKKDATHLPYNQPQLMLGDEKLEMCMDNEAIEPCVKKELESGHYAYYEVNNLDPDMTYSLAWTDTISGRLMGDVNGEGSVRTMTVDEAAPYVERIYGKIVDTNTAPVGEALVVVHSDEESIMYPFAAVTAMDGSYHISYTAPAERNFLQEFEVTTQDGRMTTYRTASFYNKPVADIVLAPQTQASASLLVSDAHANTNCSTAKFSGVRVQCNVKSPWIETLDTATCATNTDFFRVGVIEHDSVTKFVNPSSVTLKLVDAETGEYVQKPDLFEDGDSEGDTADPATEDVGNGQGAAGDEAATDETAGDEGDTATGTTGGDLVLKNGASVNPEEVGLELGKKYLVEAYDGTTECTNTPEEQPSVVFNEFAGDPIDDPEGDGDIPPMTQEANLCKKMGENFAVGYSVSAELIKEGVNLDTDKGVGYRWGEALITDLGGVDAYKKSVEDGVNLGMNMILRLCYKGTCDVEDGRAYGDKIVDVYNELTESGKLPQDGLWVHVGHNEPNAAEYRDPDQEAQFVADTVKKLDEAGILSDDPNDVGVKAIGPNLDLLASGGSWPGGTDDDPDPHPIYEASDYVEKMKQNGSFAEQAPKIYAWAGNNYYANGGSTVVSSVEGFSSSLSRLELSNKVFVTELGNFDGTDEGFEALKGIIAELDSKEFVEVILLFDSLGANPEYTYHQKFWDDKAFLVSMFENCEKATFNVPQEGEVGAQYETTGSGTDAGEIGDGNYTTTYANEAVGVGGGGERVGDYVGNEGYGEFNRCKPEDAAKPECQITKVEFDEDAHANGGTINSAKEEFVPVEEFFFPYKWRGIVYEGDAPEMWDMGGPFGQIEEIPSTKSARMTGAENKGMDAGYVQTIGLDTLIDQQDQGLYFRVKGHAKADMEVEISIPNNIKCPKEDGQPCLSESDVSVTGKCEAKMGLDPKILEKKSLATWDPPELVLDKGNILGQGPVVFGEIKDTVYNVEDLEELDLISDTGFITIFTRTDCEEPVVKVTKSGFDNSDVRVKAKYIAEWDNEGLWSVIADPDGNDQIRYLLGDSSSTYMNVCRPGESSGPNGEPCWDPNMFSANPFEAPENVMGAATITLPEKGKYQVESEAFSFSTPYVYNFSDEPRELPIFQDRDGDGQFDQDEYLAPSALDTKVTKVGDALEYDLKPGVTILSVPFYTDDFDQAVEILDQIKAQGGYATAVSAYSNTGSTPGWESTTIRGEQVYGENYKLGPDEAIYLVVQEPMKLRLGGNSYTQPVEQYVKEGWNLIAMKGGVETLLASELVDSLNQLPGVSVSKVTIWDSQKGRYTSYVVGTDGSVYGEDFLIDQTMGVFVLVDDGLGYWKP